MRRSLLLILVNSMFISVYVGCNTFDSEGDDIDDQPGSNLLYEVVDLQHIFGFEGEKRYSYCPSVIKSSDNITHIFFCGNPESSVFTDNIYHIQINSDGTKIQEKSVLNPGDEGEWDDQHVCDPSVIAGDFNYNGVKYKYALFFLGSNKKLYYNEIGVAFSNSLDADSWVKYPRQLVEKRWIGDEDQQIGTFKAWGVGQPSAVSVDGRGEILLTYTVGDKDGTRVEWSLINMEDVNNINISEPVRMISDGLFNIDYSGIDITKDIDFAIDKANDQVVMIRPVQPNPGSYPQYISKTSEIAYMNLTDFMERTGRWTQIRRITPGITKYPRNHNAALARDEFGEINGLNNLDFYYTVSKAAPDVNPSRSLHAEWTYHIWRGTIKENGE